MKAGKKDGKGQIELENNDNTEEELEPVIPRMLEQLREMSHDNPPKAVMLGETILLVRDTPYIRADVYTSLAWAWGRMDDAEMVRKCVRIARRACDKMAATPLRPDLVKLAGEMKQALDEIEGLLEATPPPSPTDAEAKSTGEGEGSASDLPSGTAPKEH